MNNKYITKINQLLKDAKRETSSTKRQEMILEMIEGIDKPALAGLWPNKIGTNIVLDLGANIECSEKNGLNRLKVILGTHSLHQHRANHSSPSHKTCLFHLFHL